MVLLPVVNGAYKSTHNWGGHIVPKKCYPTMKKNRQMITIVPHGEIIQQQWDTVIHVYECDI